MLHIKTVEGSSDRVENFILALLMTIPIGKASEEKNYKISITA